MKKRLSYILLCLILLANTIFVQAYSDMTDEYAWAKDAVNHFQKQGVINGYPDGCFRPQNHVTRAELAKLIVTLFDASGNAVYKDVSQKDWYHPYVSQSGSYFLSETNFFPDNNATREEVAYAVVTAKKLTATPNTLSFFDASEIDSRYLDAVSIAVRAGIINGYPDNTFRPNQPITRAETAVLLERSLSAVIPEEPVPDIPNEEETEDTTAKKSNNYFFLVTRVSQSVDEKGDPITKISGYNEGILEEIILKDVDVKNTSFVSNAQIQKNDIIAFTRDYFDDVRYAQILLRPKELAGYNKVNLLKIGNNEKRNIITGFAKRMYGSNAIDVLSTDGQNTQLYAIGKTANVYILKKSGKLELSDVSEIIDSRYDSPDLLVGLSYDEELKEILIIKE